MRIVSTFHEFEKLCVLSFTYGLWIELLIATGLRVLSVNMVFIYVCAALGSLYTRGIAHLIRKVHGKPNSAHKGKEVILRTDKLNL